uniref:Uncharacterized protein n=1 Tax=Rhizophora mucronata TaxID=61149 RepID=A0A2P2QML2_RHIMU
MIFNVAPDKINMLREFCNPLGNPNDLLISTQVLVEFGTYFGIRAAKVLL